MPERLGTAKPSRAPDPTAWINCYSCVGCPCPRARGHLRSKTHAVSTSGAERPRCSWPTLAAPQAFQQLVRHDVVLWLFFSGSTAMPNESSLPEQPLQAPPTVFPFGMLGRRGNPTNRGFPDSRECLSVDGHFPNRVAVAIQALHGFERAMTGPSTISGTACVASQ